MRKKTSKIVLLLICAISIIGCTEKRQKEPIDKFYTNIGGWGEMRIPLIEPLYLFCHDGHNWSLQGDSGNNLYIKNGSSVFAIKTLANNDKLFFFRPIGWGIIIESKEYPDGWFMVDTNNKLIEGYPDYESFRDTLNKRYYITDIDTLLWESPKSYYDKLREERLLPWFPDTLKYAQ